MSTDLSPFATRREHFAEALDGGIAVIPAGTEAVRNFDVHYEFRQDSDFWFLTGFHEPDAVAVIDPSHPEEQFVLFVLPRDREMEIWNGYRAGVEGARERYGADAAYAADLLDDELARRFLGRHTVYTPLGNTAFASRITGLINKVRGAATRYGREVPFGMRDVSGVIGELRLRKTPAEIESLRRACSLTALGHAEAMRFAAPGRYEYQVQAAMEYLWRVKGSRRNGYPSIVASGPNACVLHYTGNDRKMEDGDLLLVDAAAEIDYYSSDITRTFPVNGRFTEHQARLYDTTLAAQRAGIAAVRPGATLAEIELACKAVIDEAGLSRYIRHGATHYVGLEVHDPGDRKRPFVPGVAFTIEPGLYDPETSVGIRIEDVVVVTEDGCEVITDEVPKDRATIEALMAGEGVLDWLDGQDAADGDE